MKVVVDIQDMTSEHLVNTSKNLGTYVYTIYDTKTGIKELKRYNELHRAVGVVKSSEATMVHRLTKDEIELYEIIKKAEVMYGLGWRLFGKKRFFILDSYQILTGIDYSILKWIGFWEIDETGFTVEPHGTECRVKYYCDMEKLRKFYIKRRILG